jgi:hypothetical protein
MKPKSKSRQNLRQKQTTKQMPKPTLTLLRLKNRPDEVNALARLYESLTGKKPTQQELEDMKKILEE